MSSSTMPEAEREPISHPADVADGLRGRLGRAGVDTVIVGVGQAARRVGEVLDEAPEQPDHPLGLPT